MQPEMSTPPPPAPTTPSPVTNRADGHDQPGSRPGRPHQASPINFTVVFNEAVTGFATGDVTLGGTAGGTKVGTVTGERDHLQRRGQRHDRRRHRHRDHRSRCCHRCRRQRQHRLHQHRQHRHPGHHCADRDHQSGSRAGRPDQASPINFTVVFSEPVNGFLSTTSLWAGRRAPTAICLHRHRSTTYNVAVSGMTSDGTVTAESAAGAADDEAGEQQRGLHQHRQHRHLRQHRRRP